MIQFCTEIISFTLLALNQIDVSSIEPIGFNIINPSISLTHVLDNHGICLTWYELN